MTVKRLVSLILTVSLLAGMSFAFAESGQRFDTRNYDVFAIDLDRKLDKQWPLFFFDGVDDMPWIEMEELTELLNLIEAKVYKEPGYHVDCRQEGSAVTLTRENGFYMTLDFDSSILVFNDYNGFIQDPARGSLLDLLSITGVNEKGEAELFQRDTLASYDCNGRAIVLNLTDYGIKPIFEDGRGYIPLQTANDLVFSPQIKRALLFNGSAVFLANHDDMLLEKENDLSPLAYLYFSAEPTLRSQAFADFGKNELCLMLDCMYGLKQKHNITSFENAFWQIGFDEALAAADTVSADQALRSYISYYLDDLHSTFAFPSWMTGMGAELQGGQGNSSRQNTAQSKQYKKARTDALGENVESYQEVGNTAYITFDEFTFDHDESVSDYYKAAESGERLNDTIGLIAYAHRQINRENSPIENVVVDLSNNVGGAADAALFVISWLVGEAEVSVEDAFTGAQSTMVYRADINMDREFDEKDALQGKHVYCLISPVSFSCGNLVPAVCKANQAVTLIGRTSGGGACEVQPMSTAWGSTFQISGNKRLSFRKNGSFYDIDEGVAPDIYITHIETLYDREKLNNLINGLQ